jgi:hypothetical protein
MLLLAPGQGNSFLPDERPSQARVQLRSDVAALLKKADFAKPRSPSDERFRRSTLGTVARPVEKGSLASGAVVHRSTPGTIARSVPFAREISV